MKKFNATLVREFQVGIEADSAAIAERIAHQVMAQFPAGTCRLLSLIEDGYEEKPCAACDAGDLKKPDQPPPHGTPTPGGSPGTPTVSVPVLVDQVAKAA